MREKCAKETKGSICIFKSVLRIPTSTEPVHGGKYTEETEELLLQFCVMNIGSLRRGLPIKIAKEQASTMHCAFLAGWKEAWFICLWCLSKPCLANLHLLLSHVLSSKQKPI